jgi:alanine racemase
MAGNDMMKAVSRNRISIDIGLLQHNYRCIKEKVGPRVEVMAMVKGDAYGHGMPEAAAAFAACGCRAFGVAELVEAVALRQTGIEGAIYVMLGFEPHEAELFVHYDLTPVVFQDQDIRALARAAGQHGRDIGVHLKVDCGMGRLGLLPQEVPQFVTRIEQCPGVFLAGIMAHFPEADQRQAPSTPQVYALYQQVIDGLGGKFAGIRHIANSGAALNFPEMACDMVRAGISLYGYYPDGGQGQEGQAGCRLAPAMSFATRVVQVKELPAGTGISYGHTYTTDRPTRLAVLPTGYEDGYLRDLSNRGEVLIRGQRAPVRGRVCMNLCMVDVTGIDGVTSGDEAVLLGRQGDEVITADEIAAWMGTISYEVLCLFGNNNSRTYIE